MRADIAMVSASTSLATASSLEVISKNMRCAFLQKMSLVGVCYVKKNENLMNCII